MTPFPRKPRDPNSPAAKKQTRFVFKSFKQVTYSKDYIPLGYLTVENKIRNSMVRKGYLIKDMKRTETYTFNFMVAKANVSLKEREVLQQQIDACSNKDKKSE